MSKYNPKIDLVFRKLFGSEENKDILISFVNAVLEGKIEISNLEIKNPYNLSNYVKGKTSILDIKAVDEKGVWYDIEMQIGEQGYYGKRAQYYLSKVFVDQIESSEEYLKLKKTIGIHLLDFNYFDDSRHNRHVVFKDCETNEIYKQLSYQELYFIEMAKFNKEFSELKTVLDRWISFMNKAYELDKNNLPNELKENPQIVKAVEKLEKMYFDKDEREIYEAERKHRMDVKEEIRTAVEKGKEEGIEQGITQGIEQGIIKSATAFLDVLDDETISQKLNIDLEIVKKLRD